MRRCVKPVCQPAERTGRSPVDQLGGSSKVSRREWGRREGPSNMVSLIESRGMLAGFRFS